MRTATALAVCPDCQIWSSLTADWTGDGKVDLFFKPNGYAGKSATLYVNDGTGRFVPAPHTAGGTTPTFDANTMVSQSKQGYFIFGDFDNDQDLDIWLGEGTMQIYLNDGTGSFSSATTAMTQDFSDTGCRGGVAVDMDLDGDLDLMVATASGCASLSTAHVPVRSSRLPRISRSTRLTHFAHLLPTCAHACPDRMLRNDGQLQFTNVPNFIPAANGEPFGYGFADYNGDGLLDVPTFIKFPFGSGNDINLNTFADGGSYVEEVETALRGKGAVRDAAFGEYVCGR